jgi:hypothetical protein
MRRLRTDLVASEGQSRVTGKAGHSLTETLVAHFRLDRIRSRRAQVDVTLLSAPLERLGGTRWPAVRLFGARRFERLPATLQETFGNACVERSRAMVRIPMTGLL